MVTTCWRENAAPTVAPLFDLQTMQACCQRRESCPTQFGRRFPANLLAISKAQLPHSQCWLTFDTGFAAHNLLRQLMQQLPCDQTPSLLQNDFPCKVWTTSFLLLWEQKHAHKYVNDQHAWMDLSICSRIRQTAWCLKAATD